MGIKPGVLWIETILNGVSLFVRGCDGMVVEVEDASVAITFQIKAHYSTCLGLAASWLPLFVGWVPHTFVVSLIIPIFHSRTTVCCKVWSVSTEEAYVIKDTHRRAHEV